MAHKALGWLVLGLIPSQLGISQVQPPPTIPQIARAIATLEGWNAPATLVHQLHNPCALSFARQAGAELGPRGYARFRTDSAGWDACEHDLALKFKAGWSLYRISGVWSADPASYRAGLARLLGQPIKP